MTERDGDPIHPARHYLPSAYCTQHPDAIRRWPKPPCDLLVYVLGALLHATRHAKQGEPVRRAVTYNNRLLHLLTSSSTFILAEW